MGRPEKQDFGPFPRFFHPCFIGITKPFLEKKQRNCGDSAALVKLFRAMPKRGNRLLRSLGEQGLTLLEIMVSVGLSGIIFLTLMFLLAQSGKMSGKMTQGFDVMEATADAVSQFSTVIPETTRITSCLCEANTSSIANCVWNPSNPYYDPVTAGGMASGGTVLAGEFEAYQGAGSSQTSLAAQLTSQISIPGETCASSNSTIGSGMLRGCKLSYQLKYAAPTNASPSYAGYLYLKIGTGRGVGIGNVSVSGGNPVSGVNGAKGLGVVKFGCGFYNGSVFVMNLLLKAKSNLITSTTNPNYETWYPDDSSACTKNYCKGTFRDVQLKFSMRNLTHRGMYFWRPLSEKGCTLTGQASTSVAKCCAKAWDGTKCITCLPSGSAATTQWACCSQQLNGAVCL